jgi:glycine hydroxymethyltransferase
MDLETEVYQRRIQYDEEIVRRNLEHGERMLGVEEQRVNVVIVPGAAPGGWRGLSDGYHVDVEHTLDLEKALEPKVMILGKSLFLFPEPVKELAPVCKRRGIVLIYDAAHVLGLVAGHQFQDPLAEGAPLVTGSTHKTFFGSQRGVILSNVDDDEWRKIDKGAFPGSSSNHHLETLVALSVSTYEMMEFGV